ncbi:hypothetical protein LCGC14_1163570 [marine sediment metagenome]|uniref:Uncharacterized protein n=1 Tax=marine sediment metagenome TaxID=412755 RepID=A0A0F9PA67_9ZZZZ
MNPESLDNFLAWQPPVQQSLVQNNLLTPGSVMFIYGEYSTWKSWLAMVLATSLVDGKPWLIWDTEPVKVLMVNAELSKASYQKRWQGYLGKHKLKNRSSLIIENDQELALDSYAGINNYISWLTFNKVQVLIIDNLYTSMTGDLSKNTDANALIRNMKRVQAEGIAVVIVHHARQERFDNYGTVNQRAYEMFGSSFLSNWADTIMEARLGYAQGYSDVITLTPQKHRQSILVPLTPVLAFNRSKLQFDTVFRGQDDDTTSNVRRRRAGAAKSS